jgi:hypothetical protein
MLEIHTVTNPALTCERPRDLRGRAQGSYGNKPCDSCVITFLGCQRQSSKQFCMARYLRENETIYGRTPFEGQLDGSNKIRDRRRRWTFDRSLEDGNQRRPVKLQKRINQSQQRKRLLKSLLERESQKSLVRSYLLLHVNYRLIIY